MDLDLTVRGSSFWISAVTDADTEEKVMGIDMSGNETSPSGLTTDPDRQSYLILYCMVP